MKKLRSFLNLPEAGAISMLVVMVVIFTALSPSFLSYNNIQVVLQPIPELALLAIGVTILMIAGEFDLSVGSTFVLSPMVMVLVLAAGMPLPIAMLIGLMAALTARRCITSRWPQLRIWVFTSAIQKQK